MNALPEPAHPLPQSRLEIVLLTAAPLTVSVQIETTSQKPAPAHVVPISRRAA